MSEVGAEGMFALFEAYPDLLPIAIVNPSNMAQKTKERAKEKFPCCHCGVDSYAVLVVKHQTAGYRWVDLCTECLVWVRDALQRMWDRLE